TGGPVLSVPGRGLAAVVPGSRLPCSSPLLEGPVVQLACAASGAPSARAPASAAIASAVRCASAMIETIGFVPLGVGNALASPIHTPRTSWSSPHGFATEVCGLLP